MRIVYHWLNGAFVSSLAADFQADYEKLKAQFGFPACAQVLYDVRNVNPSGRAPSNWAICRP